MKRPQTNVEFVADLMEHSAHGALIQVFVIQAIDRYADLVAAAEPQDVDTPMVNGHAWRGCALEVKRKLKERLG